MIPREEWNRCRPLVEAALATTYGFETIDDVERLLEEGKYGVMFGNQSVAVFEICDYQQRKVLIVQHGGGDLAELLDVMEPALCEHARLVGCDSIMGLGRLGWKRETEKRGYRMAYIAMIKDLVN